MTIRSRIQSPTPSFFKKLRNTGLAALAIGTSIISAPIALPAVLVKIAGYLVVAGTTTAAVSQSVTGKEKLDNKGGKDGN